MFRCEYALAMSVMIVLGLAAYDALRDRIQVIGRSVVAAVGGPAAAPRR